MALPANVSFGWVTGTFMDSDGALATGTITFTPSPPEWLDPNATPPTTIIPKPVTVNVVSGTFLQQLIATDDTDLNPTGWTYQVTFALHFGTTTASIQPFSIQVPAGSSGSPVDLTTVTPVPSAGGTYYLGGTGGDPSTSVHAAAAKTSPADNDEMLLLDSAASFVLKKLTWANLKAALNAVFVPASRTINGHPLSADLTINATDVGLGNVDDTADVDKPISNDTQAALDDKQSSSTLASSVLAVLPGLVENVEYDDATSSWPSNPAYADASRRWRFIGPTTPPSVAAPKYGAEWIVTS